MPLWTPYLNLGYPLHADMQSGVWNPFVQLFSLFGPYTLYTLQLETILYIFLGGAGMFYLLRYFRLHPYANLLGSVAYMLCGFNSDSGQFLNWIGGTAFLPFVFLFYYRCLEEKSFKSGVYTGITLFFLFTCAYPADFIIIAYLMFAMLIVHFVSNFRKKQRIIYRELILSHIFLLIVFILLSGPAILSYMEGLPLQERGSGATYNAAMSNPLHPGLLSAYTTPLGIWRMPGVSITDPLERNSYFGIAGFMLLLISFFPKSPDRIVRFSRWAVLIFLLFSFGEMGGLRIISYYLLPLMNSFRHPANAKMFTIFFSCILAAYTFTNIINNTIHVKVLKKGWWAVVVFLFAILLFGLFTPLSILRPSTIAAIFQPHPGISLLNHLKLQFDNISFADLVLINTCIQIPFLFLLYRFLFIKKNTKLFLATAIVNSIFFTMAFQPFTVIKKDKASYIQGMIDKFAVTGYPMPDNTVSLQQNSLDNEKYIADIGCINLYNKKIGRSDYRITPANLLVQNKFWFNEPFRSQLMNYPLLYKAKYIHDIENWREILYDSIKNGKLLFMESPMRIHEYSANDSANIIFTNFEPNRIEGTITADQNGIYVLMQTIYPRWKLYIDNTASTIIKTNYAFMGFEVPKGHHTFSFRYEAPDIKIAFILNLGVLGLLFVQIIISFFRKNGTGY